MQSSWEKTISLDPNVETQVYICSLPRKHLSVESTILGGDQRMHPESHFFLCIAHMNSSSCGVLLYACNHTKHFHVQ